MRCMLALHLADGKACHLRVPSPCACCTTMTSRGRSASWAGYLAHGTATDYMYERLRVPLAFTWEIYGDADAHFNDCFRMFNPVSRPAFDQVLSSHCSAPGNSFGMSCKALSSGSGIQRASSGLPNRGCGKSVGHVPDFCELKHPSHLVFVVKHTPRLRPGGSQPPAS